MSKKPSKPAKRVPTTPDIDAIKQADGSTVVRFTDTGRSVVIPPGISVLSIPLDFVDHIAATVSDLMSRPGPVAAAHWWRDARGRSYRVIVRHVGKVVAVYVNDEAPLDAVVSLRAVFSTTRHRWHEKLALTHPKYRGRGLYTAVLKLLKSAYGVDIYSDTELSALNAVSWVGRGTFDPARKRFRLNSKPTAAQVRTALRLACIEAYTGDLLS